MVYLISGGYDTDGWSDTGGQLITARAITTDQHFDRPKFQNILIYILSKVTNLFSHNKNSCKVAVFDDVGIARAIFGRCPVKIARLLRKTIQYDERAYQNEFWQSKEKSQ